MNKMNDSEKTYSVEDFRRIVRELRSEHGCPWDRAQTHESVTQCMLEEAAEAVSGIRLYERTGNPDSMREELGDVLMQVVFHAQLAEEEGLFTLDDVIRDISEKMIRRHPHVFEADGTPLNGREPNPDMVKSWQEIKRIEKQKQTYGESKRKKRMRKTFAKFYNSFL